jgi:hypothetical protein
MGRVRRVQHREYVALQKATAAQLVEKMNELSIARDEIVAVVPEGPRVTVIYERTKELPRPKTTKDTDDEAVEHMTRKSRREARELESG